MKVFAKLEAHCIAIRNTITSGFSIILARFENETAVSDRRVNITHLVIDLHLPI